MRPQAGPPTTTTATGEAACVWRIAWPIILTNMLNLLVGIVDFKMVGTLGVTSIAAVGMARQVMMFLMVLMIAISGGSSVLVAHAHGSGNRDQVRTIAANAIVFMVLASLGLAMPAGLALSRPLLALLGAEPLVQDLGTAYLRILFLGAAVTMFNFAVTGILLGVGRTKVSLCLLIVINALNVLLNYVFIFGAGPVPAFGVRGAAMGTVAARAIGAAAGVWIVLTPALPINLRVVALGLPRWDLLKRIVFLGGPRSLQGIVRNFSRLMTLRIITLMPNATRAVSAYTVGMQVRMMSAFVGLAFMSAAMSRVGQNLGRNDPDRAVHSGWTAAAMATALMTAVALFFLLVPEQIMRFFTPDADVIRQGRAFFTIIALTEPVMGSAFALGGGLRGGGNPMAPFIYASISDLVVVIVLGYLLAIGLGMGMTGIAIAMAASAVTRAVPTAWTFHRGQWKTNRLA